MLKRTKFRRVPPEIPVSSLTPFEISCTSTKCEDGFHCFKVTKRMAEKFGPVCRECKQDLINWDRIHQNDYSDVAYTFEQMKIELIRHVYWHMPIKEEDLSKAISDGRARIEKDAIERLTKVIGIPNPFRNGITPYYGNIIFYAQHATASCCRVCMEYWHKIPMGRSLTKKEIEYLSKLICAYIDLRVPELKKKKLSTI